MKGGNGTQCSLIIRTVLCVSGLSIIYPLSLRFFTYFELILLNVVYKLHIKPTWQSRMEYRETQVRLGQDTDRRYTKRNIQHRNPPNKRGGGG